MKIAAFNSFKSIAPFAEIELPQLTVLTGLNGSGKSQLLEGLSRQAIKTDLFEPLQPPQPNQSVIGPSSENPLIALLKNWDSNIKELVASVPTTMAAQFSQRPEISMPRQTVAALRTERLSPFVKAIEQLIQKPITELQTDSDQLWTLGAEELAKRANFMPEAIEGQSLVTIFEDAEAALVALGPRSNPINSAVISNIAAAARELGISPLAITQDHVDRFAKRATLQMFRPHPAQIMSAYRDAHYSNLMDELRARTDNSISFLSHEEFLSQFGPQPHEWMSQLLEAMGLPFEVTPPPSKMSQPCAFLLRFRGSKEPIHFAALSSGEQVLVRFAISLMQPHPMMASLQRPKLLLLDEMDASLHPEMVQRWLSALERGIAGELGICTILTTHSPTTVALAPENSIFEMRERKPVKVSKQEALNHLTFGVPTLSINFTGRRQVFCESDTDAASYETIYAAVKARLDLPRELNFIGTGIRNKDGQEINTGETVVREIVAKLYSHGVQTVFGLIDWDGNATSSERIAVIGENLYYTLENILLDPLLLGAFFLISRIPIPGLDMKARGLDALSVSELQRLADAIQNAISIPEDDNSTIEVDYIGGAKLKIRRAYVAFNGHALEALLSKTFPALKRWTSNRGVLNREIAKVVITDYPEFCPSTISKVFEALST